MRLVPSIPGAGVGPVCAASNHHPPSGLSPRRGEGVLLEGKPGEGHGPRKGSPREFCRSSKSSQELRNGPRMYLPAHSYRRSTRHSLFVELLEPNGYSFSHRRRVRGGHGHSPPLLAFPGAFQDFLLLMHLVTPGWGGVGGRSGA